MYARYGNYTHEQKRLTITQSREALRTQRGERYALRVTIGLTGAITGSSQSELVSNFQALIDAHAYDFYNFRWNYADDTETPIQLNDANTLGGVRVSKLPAATIADQTQWANYVRYTVEYQADIDLFKLGQVPPNMVVSYQETISVRGNGGAIKTYVPQDLELWKLQQTRRFSLVLATQQGTIVGLRQFLNPPGPRWPDMLRNEEVELSASTPRRVPGGWLEYPTTFAYRYHNNKPMPGGILPNII